MTSVLRASVVVPVRDRPALLAKVLQSLTAQDMPSHACEIIVCDDGSVEDTGRVVRQFPSSPFAIRVAQQGRRGPAAARNLGIRAARAAIVVFVDSDVTVESSAVRLLVEALERQPEWQGAEAALRSTCKAAGILSDAPLSTTGGRYHTAGIAYRREALLAAGGFDEAFELPACEDVELAMRIAQQGLIGFVPEAKVWHPPRRVDARAHWRWRKHWRYETILAVRHGVLAFPGRRAGAFPRLRVAVAAILTLPAGRLRAALRALASEPGDASLAGLYALFDAVCGLYSLPSILFSRVPPVRNYLPAGARARNARTAVVVAAHRPYETLGMCLAGFREAVADPSDVIFVDNGSGGALADWASSRWPDLTVHVLDANGLFCGGYNAGVRLAMDRGYDRVLIVNADTELLNPRLLAALNDVLERHPRAAFAGPLVYYRRAGIVQTTCLPFPSVLRNIGVWLPYRLVPRAVSRQPASEAEVPFLNGVCVLCRVAALRDIGLMDETFGAYVEDTDWGWRARARGWSSVFTPVPGLIHHEEPQGYEHHSFKSFLLKRNTVYWYLKAGKPWSAASYALGAMLLAWCRAACTRTRDERPALVDFAKRLQSDYARLLMQARRGWRYGPAIAAEGLDAHRPPVAGKGGRDAA